MDTGDGMPRYDKHNVNENKVTSDQNSYGHKTERNETVTKIKLKNKYGKFYSHIYNRFMRVD